MSCLGVFWRGYCHISNQDSQICQNAKFRVKQRNFNFGTQIALYGCFWPAIFFKKTFATFETNTLKFTELQSFIQYEKS